jgi:hypothetical protein
MAIKGNTVTLTIIARIALVEPGDHPGTILIA